MANKTWLSSLVSGNWSTTSDWTPSAPAAGDSVVIGTTGNTAGFVVTEDSTVAISTLTLAGRSSATTTLRLTPTATLTTTGSISLGKSTIINGTGGLIVNGAISGGGTIAASSGLLDIEGAGSIGAGGAALSIGSLAASTLKLNLSGGVASSGSISINSANQVLEIGAAGELTINKAERITNGTIKLDGGTLTDAAGVTIGSGATLTGQGSAGVVTVSRGTISQTGGILTLASLIGSGTVNGAPHVTGAITASGGTLDLTGAPTFGSLAIAAAATSDLKIEGTVTTGVISISNALQTLEVGQAGALTINTTESITNGTIKLDGGTLTDASGIAVNSGSVIGSGTIAATIVVSGAGTVKASGGTLDLKGAVTSGTALAIATTTGSDLLIDGTATAAVAISINNTNQTLEIGAAGALTISQAESITNGFIKLDGGALTDVSGVAIGSGATLTGKGKVAAPISGAGTVTASGGVLDLNGNVTATSLAISAAAGSVLQIGGAVASGTGVAFKGQAGVLELSDVVNGIVQQFNGTIGGLNVGSSATTPTNAVNIQATVTKATLSGNAITVSNGATTIATLSLSATPTAGSYAVAEADAALGGYDVFLTNAPIASSTGTISGNVTGPFALNSANDPLTITGTGAVSSTGSGIDAIDGSSGTAWTITNSGIVTSAGGDAMQLLGAGTVSNQGRISGIEGVKLNAGGNVSNASSGSISASGTVGGGFGIGAGVYIAHAPGSVTNNGIISGGAYGVAMSVGGSVTNTASINGGEDGVIFNGGFGTVSNTGQIIASVDDGIGMFTGGSVTNATGALISGSGTVSAGIFITGGLGSVLNSGRITTNNGKFGVLLTGSGGSVSNAASGSIDGYTAGVFINGQPGTVTNAGSITATGPSGVDLEAGGKVTNQTSGIISGHLFGVFITGGSGTVANSGAISSGKYGAIELTSGGNVTNNAGGSISGSSSGVYFGSKAAGTVTNSGSITAVGVASAGVQFALGGSVINNSGGSISGTGFGVFATGAAGTLTNFGTITGLDGIGLKNGGNVTNETGASILGQSAGVFSQGGVATLSNTGSISATGSGGAALDIEAGGSISNAAGGSITGASFGVFVTGGSGTIVNAGRIAGTSNTGIDLASGGNVSNAAGASISAGGFGVAVYGTGGTVTNAGTISGLFSAVHFGAGTTNDLLVVDPGSVFNGSVAGGGGTNTLELAQGVSAGSIGGIGGSSFAGFGTVNVDSGASWTLSGSNTIGSVLNNGTLAIASGGSLDVTTAIDPASKGLFNLNSAALLEIAADAGSADQIAFLAPAEVIIDTASLFGTNAGQNNYGGPLIEDFGVGDTIDLKGIASAGITLNYTSSTGLLQVASGGTGVASLLFQNSTLGAGAFHSTDDGTGHTLLTVA